MAVTGTYTVREIIEAALLDIEAMTMGQAIPAKQADHAKHALNRMLKSWQLMEGSPDFLRANQSVTATTNANHTMSPVRPIRILNANVVTSDGTEIPMTPMSRDQYERLPDKTVTGTPTQFYYDRQKESAVFYVWPVFASVTTETFEIDYEREFEDIASLNDVIDLPSEWYDIAVMGLAARLVNAYGSEQAKATVPAQAAYALNSALAAGMSGESVYLHG